ncbi:oligosaccharide flippase family protein [Pseudomonas frederiksbergensis]|uniref:oligosaccharide flippase family protein n=1 Tax=Pseudomonas frederiksbergensis TaxID=104087 RepID=UPI003D20A74E
MNNALLKKFVSSTAWSFISAVATKVSVVITGILVARVLGAQSFGEYGLIQSAIVMLANVAAQATTTATAKHIGQFKEISPEKTGRGIALTLIFALSFSAMIIGIALFFPIFFSNIILGSDNLKYVSLIVLSTITFIILSGWTQGCLTGWGQYRSIATINGIIAIVAIPGTYFLTTKFRLSGALLGLACSQLLIVFFSALACWKTLKEKDTTLSFKGVMTEKHTVLSVGLPVLLTGLMVAPMNWLANKLLAETSNGLAALGMYAAAMQWNAIFSHVSVVLGSVLVPMLAATLGGKSRKLDALNFLSGWLVVLIVIQPVIMFPELLAKLYGDSFLGRDFEITLILVILGSLLSAFKSGISRKMIVMDLAWYSVMSNILWGVLFISGALLLREEGAVGIAKAFIGSQLIHFLLGLPYFIYKKILPLELLISPRILVLWALPFVTFLSSTYIESVLYRSAIVVMIFMYILATTFTLNSMFNESAEIGNPA